MSTATINPLPEAASTTYVLSDRDRDLIRQAAHIFSNDWRYLLDMVQTANRTTRTPRQKSQKSLAVIAGDYDEVS